MVCEALSDYVCNTDMNAAEGRMLEDTVLSLLDGNLGQNHHVYLDNFYDCVKVAETLIDRNVRVCGTMRANRGIPRDLEREAGQLKK
jgi:hypothetical protein